MENSVHTDTHLFYSDNLNAVTVEPICNDLWLCRVEFTVQPSDRQYFLLRTNGITSKADIYMNDDFVASSEEQPPHSMRGIRVPLIMIVSRLRTEKRSDSTYKHF